MNILIATPLFPPIITGTSFYSRNVANALLKRGHGVGVVAPSARLPQPDNYDFAVTRIPCVPLGLRHYFKHWNFSSLHPGNYAAISRLIAEKRIDVVFLINHYMDIAFPVIRASRRHRVPVVVSIGTPIQSAKPFLNGILGLFDRLICGRLVLPHCDRIVCWDNEISRYLSRVHSHRFVHKQAVVPFGPNDESVCMTRSRHTHDFHGRIVCVGSVIDHRNYLFPVRVFHRLLQTFPHLELRIIGHVYDDSAVRLTARLGLSDRVAFLGERPHEEVLCELQQSDIHWNMLDAEYRSLGTSNLEAMLMGIPIVSNAPPDLFPNGGLTDMVDYLYTDGACERTIAEKIAAALQSEELRSSIGCNGRRFVQEYMGWHRIAERLEAVFAQTASQGKPGPCAF